MKIEFPLYIAIDPTPLSEIVDVGFEVRDFADLENMILGRSLAKSTTATANYQNRNPTPYTTKAEAREDAQARLDKRDGVGPWVPLSTLRPGAVFATKAGDRGVVHGGTAPDGLVRVVLLTNGGEETLYGHASVREVRV